MNNVADTGRKFMTDNEETPNTKIDTNQLYSDIKDLTYVLYNNYVEQGKEIESLRENERLLNEKIVNLEKLFENKLNVLKEEIRQLKINREN